MRETILILCLLLASVVARAQQPGIVAGRVIDEQGEPVVGAYVYLDKTAYASTTDMRGHFQLQAPVGSYTLISSMMGYEKKTRLIQLRDGHTHTLNVTLALGKNLELNEVQVKGKLELSAVRESPFNVVALDAKAQYNSTLDLGHMLARASGIKIRESGGVGGDLNVTLNGFTGRNVRIFMDGVPMQGNSSSFQLNNIPVSLAERIEVYKGVVPVEFGGDALGGAINIVTNRTTNSYLDASYSYGSFNTHRTNVIVGHTTPKGFSINLNAYQTYSDNDYRIKSRLITNGQYSRDTYWFRRFNAAYRNETVVAKVGWVGKPWADRFFVGTTFSQDQQEVQNAPANIEFVYGEVQTSRSGIQPILEYYKRDLLVKGLSVRASAIYNFNTNRSVDTSSYKYNWLGERTMAVSKGERGTAALSDFYNSNYSIMANVSYEINEAHAFTLNDVQTGSERRISSTAPVELLTEYERLRRYSLRNVLGFSYRYRPNPLWNVNVFGKNYYQQVIGPYNSADEAHPNWLERDATYNTLGYGIAATYFWKYLQVKTSVERAYRLPSDNELFGDENTEVGNAALRAENSMNYNLGMTINKPLKNKDVLYLDVSGYHRNTDDFIRREILVRTGTLTSVNFGNTLNYGVDLEARYYIKNKAAVGGTYTIMTLYDNEPYRGSEGTVLNTHYKDRLPNVPFQYGNLNAAYYLHDIGGKGTGNVLNLDYNLNYVYRFFLNWESLGSAGSKYILPTQLSHDFSATYIIKGGRYNFSFEARNITNAELADNFGQLKPGRAFYGKVRVYLMKRRKPAPIN